MVYLGADRLKEVMEGILRDCKVEPESASHLVESVVEASLKGIDTHGLALFPHYVEGFRKGRINKRPQFKIIKDNGSAKLIDADGAIGHHADGDDGQAAVVIDHIGKACKAGARKKQAA